MTLQRILVLLLVATTMESATEADETTTEASPKAMMMTDPGSESTPEKFTSAAVCPIGAEWSNCVECNSDCATLYMVCTEGCREGCKCIGPGYVFYEGSCIPASNCPTPAETTTFTISDTIETTMETTQETSPSESTTTETTTTDWPASTTSTTANRFTTGSWTTVTPPYSPLPIPKILPCTQLLKGDTGIPGLQGLKGDPGINGTNGEKGDPGQMGAQGPKGEVGDVLYVGRNCKELLDQGVIMSGWYTIYPDGMAPLQVLCDMDTDGGGWIVFQRRYDGSVDFYLGWDTYKKGFGSRLTDFWLGNDNLSNLTSAGTWDLRVDLRDFNNSAYYAKYSSFQISPASDNYTLTFGAFLGGNAGDSLSYHNQTSFSTKDRDNDRSLNNCAVEVVGAWWFNNCFFSHLNGVYQLQQSGNIFGITWQSANDYSYYSFKRSEMKIRPV